MLYKITSVEEKNKDWKMVSGTGVDGTTLMSASVNRTSQKGDVFPNFDAIAVGAEIEGEPWANQSGKQYLFAPREKKAGGARRGGVDPIQVAQAQERTKENVSFAQDNKDKAVRLSGAMNHAVNIVTSFNKDLTPEDIKNKVLNWRNWFLDNWDRPEADASEIPF